MTAKLFCKTGELKGASYVVADKATIGKDSTNTISLRPTTLSRRHAVIFFDADQDCYFLQDLESRNGTRLDGVRVTGVEKLRNLHIITLADDFDFIFQVTYEKSEKKPIQPPIANKLVIPEQTWSLPSIGKRTAVEDKTEVAGAIMPFPSDLLPHPLPTSPAVGVPTLKGSENLQEDKTEVAAPIMPLPQILPAIPVTIFSLERTGTPTFILKEGENSVGRESVCDIVISHASLSRRHAVVTVRSNTVTVRDLGSKNKTWVNGEAIASEMTIISGAEIRFGSVITILKGTL
jgi:pSer/pThr/pTyr-binding forkhead associated (FHA) protein